MRTLELFVTVAYPVYPASYIGFPKFIRIIWGLSPKILYFTIFQLSKNTFTSFYLHNSPIYRWKILALFCQWKNWGELSKCSVCSLLFSVCFVFLSSTTTHSNLIVKNHASHFINILCDGPPLKNISPYFFILSPHQVISVESTKKLWLL